MDKSKKIVSLFLSSALVIGLAGCNGQPRTKTVYDQNGNPVQVIEEDDDNYHGGGGFMYWISSPFRSRPPVTGITPGTSGQSSGTSGISSGTSDSIKPGTSSGISGGITSGAKGGIGSSGSSVS